jgi:hypothetical protein
MSESSSGRSSEPEPEQEPRASGSNEPQEPAHAPDVHEPDDSRARILWDRAVATGSLAAIATGGALIGLGMRDGDSSRVFRLAGRGLLERFGIASGAVPLTSVGVGYLHHIMVATLWGVALSLLVLPLRGVTRVIAAVIAAACYAWLSVVLVPAALRIGYSVTSNVGSAVPIGVSLAVALLSGVWLAATDTRG